MTLLSSRPCLGYAPSLDYCSLLENSLFSIKPNGMNHSVQLMCGACSVENALKLAFMLYMVRYKSGKPELIPLYFRGTREVVDLLLKKKLIVQ